MSEWHEVKRLLIAFLGDSDDVRDLLPALQRLRAALPRAGLGWLGLARALPVQPVFPAFDSMVVCGGEEGTPLGNLADVHSLVDRVQRGQFDATIIFTRPGESPWLAGYTCYLAGVPLRAGQSIEFGGGVLSHVFKPPADAADRHVALLEALGMGVAKYPARMEKSWSD